VLDALVDADEPLSVSRIIAELPTGISRNTAESAIKRCFDSGQIERVSPGNYALAKPKPAKPPQPPTDEAALFAALEAWATDPASWDAALGPPPDDENTTIPLDIGRRFFDRLRKREERRQDREAAAARQAQADAELKARLLRACNGNYTSELVNDDLAPIKAILQIGVPVDHCEFALRSKVDRRSFPGHPALTTWRDATFLRAVADSYSRAVLIPSMLKAWSEAGKTPGKPAAPAAPAPPEAAAAPATQPGAPDA
jgi:hypothetical protein